MRTGVILWCEPSTFRCLLADSTVVRHTYRYTHIVVPQPGIHPPAATRPLMVQTMLLSQKSNLVTQMGESFIRFSHTMRIFPPFDGVTLAVEAIE